MSEAIYPPGLEGVIAGETAVSTIEGGLCYRGCAAEAAGMLHWEQTADIIERILADEKHLFPNLDWPAGRLYYALGLEIPLYTPQFVMARVAGWSAHFIEQHENNRLIRPRSHYVGPEVRSVQPFRERG